MCLNQHLQIYRRRRRSIDLFWCLHTDVWCPQFKIESRHLHTDVWCPQLNFAKVILINIPACHVEKCISRESNPGHIDGPGSIPSRKVLFFKVYICSTFLHLRDSIVVSISACHAEDLGSIPSRGINSFELILSIRPPSCFPPPAAACGHDQRLEDSQLAGCPCFHASVV